MWWETRGRTQGGERSKLTLALFGQVGRAPTEQTVTPLSHTMSPPSALRRAASRPGSLEGEKCFPLQLSNSSVALEGQEAKWGRCFSETEPELAHALTGTVRNQHGLVCVCRMKSV